MVRSPTPCWRLAVSREGSRHIDIDIDIDIDIRTSGTAVGA
jgi:hypothetical protein